MTTGKRILSIILLAVFLCSVGMVILHYIQSNTGMRSDREAAALAGIKNTEKRITQPAEASIPPATEADPPTVSVWDTYLSDPLAEELLSIDLAALREVNPEVIGWLCIPDTTISYPLVQTDNNDYYLNFTWDKKASFRGAIFLDRQSSPELTDFNTIIYGHNLLDLSMFSPLHEYKNAEFFQAHPYVYIVTDIGVCRYRIFAMYEVPTTAATFRIGFNSDAQKAEFLESCTGWSVLETGIVPAMEDHILTLSTCTGVIRTNRWVVQAQLEGMLEPPQAAS